MFWDALVFQGPADVLNVEFSETPALQVVRGDQPLTLGIAYAFVGVGCFVGPIASNAFFGKKEVQREFPLRTRKNFERKGQFLEF